ncbi:Rap1a/Tai family immunity protein [Cohaesibacter marisflavi]|uniref:Rap1a/Tai family immunity protein n=1 Tax=Cohaesibacter marisflavi TaxID=655353 RepID=UPI0029C83993|nr:Rap1a/Tai family immunity protein [Cohaesibacter marisflavi]
MLYAVALLFWLFQGEPAIAFEPKGFTGEKFLGACLSDDPLQQRACNDYFSAVIQSYKMGGGVVYVQTHARIEDEKERSRAIWEALQVCHGAAFNPKEAQSDVIKHLQQNPSMQRSSADLMIIVSLMEMFPCN